MATKLNPLMQYQQQYQLQQPPQQQQQQQLQQQPQPQPQQQLQLQQPPQESGQADAPPKQVAVAMERLSQAARSIADVRLGADRILEALFIAEGQPPQRNKAIQLLAKEDVSMRQHLQDLRSIGRQLEESGVLNDSLRSRSNSWGLHMPLVCPDGAVVAYAWKRQLAGQAGASAVDRTRLALKAFTDQKKRFFPHLDDEQDDQNAESPATKKPRSSQVIPPTSLLIEELSDCKTLSDVLARIEKEIPNVKLSTFQRLDWLKRASSLPASANENPLETPKEHAFRTLNKLRTGVQTASSVNMDKVAVIELVFNSTFRAVVSLHPVGSIEPDGIAFFSPDEGGSYIQSRGSSTHHVFRHMTEHAGRALQYFLGIKTEIALFFLLHWVCSYQTIFSKVCSKCGRLLAMDRKLSLFLPPVYRPYRQFCPLKASPTQTTTTSKDQALNVPGAYHIGCFSEDV